MIVVDASALAVYDAGHHLEIITRRYGSGTAD